jgi:hypothetical protein
MVPVSVQFFPQWPVSIPLQQVGLAKFPVRGDRHDFSGELGHGGITSQAHPQIARSSDEVRGK